MRHFGIIGYPLEHSSSQTYFTTFFQQHHIDATFEKLEITEIQQLTKILAQHHLDGFTVTHPYKEQIIPFLDELRSEVGTVNVVKCQAGRLIGYNTDYIGFEQSIRPFLTHFDSKALILGTGGVAKAVAYGLQQMAIPYAFVSRQKPECLHYEQLDADMMAENRLIINCTPLGMFPAIDTCPPIPYSLLRAEHILFDCIYNPLQSLFLQKGEQNGCTTINGWQMFEIQAQQAWMIWEKE